MNHRGCAWTLKMDSGSRERKTAFALSRSVIQVLLVLDERKLKLHNRNLSRFTSNERTHARGKIQ